MHDCLCITARAPKVGRGQTTTIRPKTATMKTIDQVQVCCVDSGLFPHIALCLAEHCKHVFYVGPRERVMPRLADAIVGDGFENITRIADPWSVKNEVDFFCYTDIGLAGEQRELVSQGAAVWGHHGADELETGRGKFLATLKELGMQVPTHTVIKGMSALREHLYDTEDVYIKVSRFRGDFETLHWRNWAMDEATLDCIAYRLGPAKELITFYVFDSIETDVEDGVDTWCIDGQWPKKVLHALERKDKSLIGGIQDFEDVAEPVREVNEKFAPVLERYGYRGAFSTEVRLNDKAYFIDPTCRFGSPPSQLQTVLIKNLPEIIWRGANGEIVEPEAPESIGAQVLITSDREKDEWLTIQLPEELRPCVKSAFSCEIDGMLTIAPNPLENWAGWLTATGDTIKEVIDRLKEYKEMLPSGFDCDLSSLADLLRELDEAKEQGVEITEEPIPKPEIALQKD